MTFSFAITMIATMLCMKTVALPFKGLILQVNVDERTLKDCDAIHMHSFGVYE